jgi:hypothetical protein
MLTGGVTCRAARLVPSLVSPTGDWPKNLINDELQMNAFSFLFFEWRRWLAISHTTARRPPHTHSLPFCACGMASQKDGVLSLPSLSFFTEYISPFCPFPSGPQFCLSSALLSPFLSLPRAPPVQTTPGTHTQALYFLRSAPTPAPLFFFFSLSVILTDVCSKYAL